MAEDKLRRAIASPAKRRVTASPTYTSFPKPQVEAQDINPLSPENISIRQKGELREADDAKKKKKEADAKPKEFTSMTGSRIIPGGDTGALKVLASLYDNPTIRMFIAASQPRKK